MTNSSTGLGQSVLSASAKGREHNGSKLALEISRLEGFVMGAENRNKIGNSIGDVRTVDAAPAAPSTMAKMTAAALLWGRGPMTSAPLTTSSLPQQSSDVSNQKTKANSPASNAAAALLVGMSMRKEREANMLQATRLNQTPDALPSNEQAKSEDNDQFDVESKWRDIRREISQESQIAALGGSEQEDGLLELPKGVTKRPSGAWQAQIYFAGKTRYIGVWERPQQAAMAYNMAKESLKDLKAQQKGFRKRQRNHPGMIDTNFGSKTPSSTASMMATPHKNLPPSITWPSSASSSSTTSSGGFFSPTDSIGPFKKQKGNESSPESKASFGTILPHPQQQQGLEQASASLPHSRAHPYSAFSFHQQQIGGSSGSNPLTHPALQLLSLRPPQPQTSLWMQLPQYHPPQQYQQQPRAPQQFPYSEAIRGKKGTKKSTKSKRLKQAVPKKSKPKSTNNSSDAKDKAEKDAQNLKWKTIRAEVVALFDEQKKSGDNVSKPTKTFDKDVLRGITVRPSGKFQAQLYFGGRSRYIGVFDSEYEAASAYEMIRSRLKDDVKKAVLPSQSEALSTMPSCKQGKNSTAIDTTTAMRSITPSPTPRNDVQCKTSKAIAT